MRILFVQSIGKNKFGGGEKWAINAASGLQRKGHFVMMAGRKNGILLEEARKRNLATYHICINNDFNLLQVYRLSHLLKKNKIDVVICKGRELVVSALAAKWAGNILLIRRTGLPPSKKSMKLILRTKWFVDGIITNTNTIREVYKMHGFTDENFVKVIYNGFSPDDTIPPFDFSKNYPGRFIILSVGRLVRIKGYYYLIDALKELKKIYPSVLLFVLGEGKEKAHLINYAKKEGVEEMIHFAGYVSNVIPYVKGAQMFVHASLKEGMPNAAMEALAFGKPVVMTNVNGAEELTEDGRYAELIPAEDASAIAGSIRNVIENQEKYAQKGRKAQKFVREKFSMENMVDALEYFLQERLFNKKNHG